MRIRSKLLLLLTVPLLAVAIAAATGFRSESIASERAERAIETAERIDVVHRATASVLEENLVAAGSQSIDPEDLIAQTDAAIGALVDHGQVRGDATLLEVAAEVERLVAAARASSEPGPALQSYGTALRSLTAVTNDAADAFVDNETLNQYYVTRLVGEGMASQLEAWLTYLGSAGAEDTTATIIAVNTHFATSRQYFDTADQFSPGADAALADVMGELGRLEAVAIDDLAEGGVTLGRDDILPPLTEATVRWLEVIEQRDADLVEMVTADLEAAERVRSLFTLLAVLGAAVLGGMVFVVYRSITNPLGDLLVRADTVAHTELPALVRALRDSDAVEDLPVATPIVSESDDEIGELIEAFNDVQRTAYDLATEQAIGRRNVSEMFVNLGRRNQQLLQRMLSKLTELERDEEDPDTLEELFHLDNIVTRMRRNAESLLVLAGAQSPRQWSAPVAIDDAVRAAFGEVEGYERIDIAALSDADIRGNVVADVAHLLAELLENSLNFSAATTKVLVSGQHERSGYLVTIFDQGIGMDPDELAEANRRISDPPPLDQVPTKFLGLFVVGRLAERHGIDVRLLEAPGRGVMARVHLPAAVLVGDQADPAPEYQTEPVPAVAAVVAPVADPAVVVTAERSITDIEPDALPVRSPVEAAIPAAPTELPTRPTAPTAPAAPVAADGELPLRPTAPTASGDELPTRPAAPTAGGGGLPTRPTAPAAPVQAEGTSDVGALPTRSRGASLPGVGAEDDEHPMRRKTDGGPARPADATEFSSMMSAFSSGISRGLEESRIAGDLDDRSTFHTDPADIDSDDTTVESDERSQP